MRYFCHHGFLLIIWYFWCIIFLHIIDLSFSPWCTFQPFSTQFVYYMSNKRSRANLGCWSFILVQHFTWSIFSYQKRILLLAFPTWCIFLTILIQFVQYMSNERSRDNLGNLYYFLTSLFLQFIDLSWSTPIFSQSVQWQGNAN